MDAVLKKLLAAEARAEELVAKAQEEREQIIKHALQEAQALEKAFEQESAVIYRSYIEKAENKAEQTVAELQRRCDEQDRQLRVAAQRQQQAALETALRLFIPGKGA